MSQPASIPERPAVRAGRAAARRLVTEGGPDLRFEVETVLTQRDPRQRPEQFVDPVTLGSLIVSTAALAWTIVKDIRAKNLSPSVDRVIRQVRIELPATHEIPAETRDKIIDVVVQELFKDDEN